MNKEDWEFVKERLQRLCYMVELDCDGYILSLSLARIDTYKNAIIFYVNGWNKVKWLLEDCEERRRFCRPSVTYVWSKKQRAALKRIKTKKLDYDKTITTYSSYWKSFGALKRHLIKNNKEIKLIKEEEDHVRNTG